MFLFFASNQSEASTTTTKLFNSSTKLFCFVACNQYEASTTTKLLCIPDQQSKWSFHHHKVKLELPQSCSFSLLAIKLEPTPPQSSSSSHKVPLFLNLIKKQAVTKLLSFLVIFKNEASSHSYLFRPQSYSISWIAIKVKPPPPQSCSISPQSSYIS